MTEKAQSLAEINARIACAAKMASRDPADVTLIAVSKTRTVEEIAPLIAQGQRDFGENRVQEAHAKWPDLLAANPGLRLHLIGQLQSNKAEEAIAIAHVIHTIDRPSLVTAVARAMVKTGRRPDCFIQVNLADEPQKGGCAVPDLAALIERARADDLPIIGLMCLPPAELEPAPWFALLGKIADDHGLSGLSMGMSGDFETAVKLGATHVRIGSALFGERL